MKQYELAAKIWQTAKETKYRLSLENTSRNIFKSLSPEDYLNILKNLESTLYSLIPENDTAGLISEADSLCSHLNNNPEDKTQFHVFYDLCNQIINCILIEIILYQENYCIIQRNNPTPGLASHIITNLGQISACLDAGYIPVIDMQTANTQFLPLSEETGCNAWELFFKQPFPRHNISRAANGNIVACKNGIPSFMPSYNMDCLTNRPLMNFWHLLMKKYMPFSDAMEESMQEAYSALPFDGNKILGVLCRGTDYTFLRPKNHPAQPDVNEILSHAKETMNRFSYDYCYLATEDESVLSVFRDTFQEKLITSQKTYFPKESAEILSQTFMADPLKIYTKNREYLISLFLLSKCNSLIAGRTSGTVVTMLLKPTPYEYLHIYNEGRYGVDDNISIINHSIF